jgi:hypothetical protein
VSCQQHEDIQEYINIKKAVWRDVSQSNNFPFAKIITPTTFKKQALTTKTGEE